MVLYIFTFFVFTASVIEWSSEMAAPLVLSLIPFMGFAAVIALLVYRGRKMSPEPVHVTRSRLPFVRNKVSDF